MPPLPKIADLNSPEVKDLCNKLSPETKPVHLKVEPVKNAVENDCFGNVEKATNGNNGGIQYGWKLWETLPGLMIEAEFHAVWVDSSGAYREVSPEALPDMQTILFLPDSSREYDGCQIDNVRIPLKDEPSIKEFIENAEAYYEATNRGDLATYQGELTLTPEMKALLFRKQQLFIAIIQKFYI